MRNNLDYADSDIDGDDEDNEDNEFGNVLEPKRRILTRNLDEPVESTTQRIVRGRLILQPEFQRQYVWPKSKASSLIESILLGIPLPSFYMAELPSGKWEAVDGQQRLTSINAFIQGRFPSGEPAKLSRLRIRKDLNGKTFSQLPDDDQETIQNYSLRVILIEREADPNLKYEVFERLNSGSQVLSDMELRNCIYRGPYNDLLKDLTENKYLLAIRGAKGPDEKMKDRQYILRFFAMCRKSHLRYKSPMKRFLNEEMEPFRHPPTQEIERLRELFEAAIECAYIVFGSHAFRRYSFGDQEKVDGSWPSAGTINVALWDTILYGFSLYEKRQIVASADAIREEFLDLLTHDDKFLDFIGRSTDRIDRIQYRAETWLGRLRAVINVPSNEPRQFSRALKIKLFNADPSCAICGQHIFDLNDSELDHVRHYWRGGATIPENARLTHRFCNRHRGGRP
jgi:hypothetical protein